MTFFQNSDIMKLDLGHSDTLTPDMMGTCKDMLTVVVTAVTGEVGLL